MTATQPGVMERMEVTAGELEYAELGGGPPTPAEAEAVFASVGLTGDFWRLRPV